MKIRTFQAGDIPSILEIYDEHFHEFPISYTEFIHQHICDLNFDENLFLIAEEEGKVIGFLFGIIRKVPYLNRGLEEDKAWIKLMAVNSKFQNQGVGSGLLHEFESKVFNRTIILAFYSPSYFFSGVQEDLVAANAFFEHHGYYKKEASYWMERSLIKYEIPEKVKAKKRSLEESGFSFIEYEDQYSYSLLKMIKENFSMSWANYVADAIRQNRAQDEIILCLHQNSVVGYISRASIDQDAKRLGPFGVEESYRNHKLGEILIHCMFDSMAKKGIEVVFFKSTEENGKRFYLRQNIQVKKIFQKMEKGNNSN